MTDSNCELRRYADAEELLEMRRDNSGKIQWFNMALPTYLHGNPVKAIRDGAVCIDQNGFYVFKKESA